MKVEIPKENKHPWDIAHEIIQEQNKAAPSIKWSNIPTETLFDEQFLNVLHAIEEITDTSPLRDAAINLPKDIYEIVKRYEKIPVVPVETTDNLIYNISQTYCYAVIESLCKIIKAGQQGQRTSLVLSWPENQGFLFFYISKTLQMIQISFMASLLNAVL